MTKYIRIRLKIKGIRSYSAMIRSNFSQWCSGTFQDVIKNVKTKN